MRLLFDWSGRKWGNQKTCTLRSKDIGGFFFFLFLHRSYICRAWRACIKPTQTTYWPHCYICCCLSVAQSCPTLCDPTDCSMPGFPVLQPTPGACSISCPLNWWCHPTISSSVIPFSSCLRSFPASGSFPISQFFTSGGQSIGASASASVLPMNIQDWSPCSPRDSLVPNTT